METLSAKRLQLAYDKDADVLYVSFGPPREAISEETEDGMLVRKHPETGEIVGITVLDFERRFGKRDASAILPVALERVHVA